MERQRFDDADEFESIMVPVDWHGPIAQDLSAWVDEHLSDWDNPRIKHLRGDIESAEARISIYPPVDLLDAARDILKKYDPPELHGVDEFGVTHIDIETEQPSSITIQVLAEEPASPELDFEAPATPPHKDGGGSA